MPYFTNRGIMPLPTVSFTGPGDYATFGAWWGLRGYSSAQLSGSTAAIRIVKASDGTAGQDINILSTGALDTATILGLGYAVKVTKIYDQTGNGFDCEQTTLAAMPPLTIGASELNAGLPALTGDTGVNMLSTNVVPGNIIQPYCMSTVCIRRSAFTTSSHIIGANGSFQAIAYDSVAHQAILYAGASAPFTATNSVWLAINALFTGASSSVLVNGTTIGSLSPSTDPIVAGEKYFICGSDGVAFTNGDICEGGVISSDASANFAAIETNQRAYWGI